MQRIVGIDPGKITGLVAFCVTDDSVISNIESYELNIVGIGNYLSERINESTIIAYEVANKFQASGHVSSEVIGLVKYFGAIYFATVVPVTQSSHKLLISRKVLKKAGLYVKGPHAKDAAGIGFFHVISALHLCEDFLREGA